MSFLADLAVRCRALLFRGRIEKEMEEELATHLHFETEAQRRAGHDTGEARRRALVAFGGLDRWKEETRDARGLAFLDGAALDLRQSVRALRRHAGFTVAVVLVLGLAIGAATAVFTVVRAVLLRELPYASADRLVRVYQQNSPTNRFGLSTVDVQAIEAEPRVFEAFGAVQWGEAALSGVGSPERIVVGRADAGFFQALGLRAIAGRLVGPEDQGAEAPPVAVVAYDFAERHLGGAEAAPGQSLVLDGVAHTVIGVLPRGYVQLAGVPAGVWPALRLQPPTRRGPFWLRGIGRLKPGVTLDQATRELAAVSARVFPVWAASFRDQTARLTPYPLRQTLVGGARGGLTLLAGAVALALLVAVANVATLMLVRGSARQPELAVRAALGAGQAHLGRLLVIESLLLTLGALVVALITTAIGLVLFRRHAALPRIDEVALDPGAVLLAVGLALGAGILVTLSPLVGLRTRHPGRLSSARAGIDPRTTRLRSVLVGAEFALALPLLFGAALLLSSFLHLTRLSPGFDADGVVAVSLALPSARYPDLAKVEQFFAQAEARVGELPGVTAAGLSSSLPPDDASEVNNFDLLDHPVDAGTAEPVAVWSAVTPGYFAALGVPLLEGRMFTPEDTSQTAPVLLVSRAWASRFYPGQSAVGHQLYSGGCRSCAPTTIIGVVGDVKYQGLSESAEAAYLPLAQYGAQRMYLLVRTRIPGAGIVSSLRSTLTALDPDLPLRPFLLADRVYDSLNAPRRWSVLVTGFAFAAAALAALGVYGLMAYLVRQRQREIGVRIALGAEPARVTREVVGRGMLCALAGSAAGIGLALLGAGWMTQMLYGVGPRDPAMLLAAVALMLGSALLSCWLPGRHAARVNLTAALGTGD